MPDFPNPEPAPARSSASSVPLGEPDGWAGDNPYRALFDAVDVGFCIIELMFDAQDTPLDYRFLDVNPAFERHTGLTGSVGKTARELVPDLDKFWFQTYGKVALTGEPIRFENHAPAMGRWFEVYALRVGDPAKRSVALLFTETTARKQSEQALRQSEADLRKTQTLLESALSAGSIATWSFDVVNNRVNADANLARLFSVDAEAALGGELAVYMEAIHENDRERVAAIIAEAIARTDRYEAEYRVVLPDGSHRWLIARGKVERDTEGNALSLPGVVVDVTPQIEAQQAQQKLLIEARAQAEREALLNRIGLAVRDSRDPDAILQTVVTLLGEGLSVDRCYFVRYDQVRDTARVEQEWMRAERNLAPLVGQKLQMSRYSVDRDTGYKGGNTHVVNDAVAFNPNDAGPLLALDIRALLRVPIEAGNQMTTLAVAMANGPREWTPDEVRLMENAASLLRSVLESASLVQRERNIAQQLQDALRPASPGSPPGLALASYYQPALAEASVGGDFFDVFTVEPGCVALVVADLSGKGLAAASQVATVRNMLRFSLYTGKTVSQAITTLHDALVEHDLLTGFATLFVGIYDQNEHTLTYVNCGQEPGLLWRADQKVVEALVPTGPVLGGFASGAFEQRTVALVNGDVLALFTDGLTEVGPNRKELLEVEGVSALLRDCCADAKQKMNAQAIVDALIARVDGFAQGGVRDDIALLVGVAQSAAS